MIPRDVAGTAEPYISSPEFKPDKTAALYALCPSCQTLYLGVMGQSVICCRRHVSCAVQGDDPHCIDIQNECPVQFAYRVVDYRP